MGSCPDARDSDGETVGWAALEGLAGDGTLPRVLADSPKEPFPGVRGVIAWYPYGGFAANYRKGWQSDVPVHVAMPTVQGHNANRSKDLGHWLATACITIILG